MRLGHTEPTPDESQCASEVGNSVHFSPPNYGLRVNAMSAHSDSMTGQPTSAYVRGETSGGCPHFGDRRVVSAAAHRAIAMPHKRTHHTASGQTI